MDSFIEFEKRLREADSQALKDFQAGKAPAPIIYKSEGYFKESHEGIQVFVASEDSVDRIGDQISVNGWELENYKKNPVFMFCHDYSIAPVGTVPKVWIEDKQLLNVVKWDEEDEFAKFLKGKYDRKIMRAESVGFKPIEFKEIDNGYLFLKQELLEISAVPIPAHPAALAKVMATKKFSIVVPQLIDVVEKPEVTEDYVRIPVSGEEGKHDGHRIRTIDISEKEGIKALYCGECKKVITYLFAKDHGWNMQKAKDWVEAHKKEYDLEIVDKIGAVLNRSNQEKLLQAKVLIDEVLSSASKPEESNEEKIIADAIRSLRKSLQGGVKND